MQKNKLTLLAITSGLLLLGICLLFFSPANAAPPNRDTYKHNPENNEGSPSPNLLRAGPPATVDIRITSGNDDAEERQSNGFTYRSSSDLEMVEDGSIAQIIGLRFQNVTVPPNAIIVGAYLEFTTDEIDSGSTSLTFHGQTADDPPAFDASNYDISSRSTTTASVDWNNIPAWNTVGETHQTPELTTIVQELINRSGWARGNALVFIVTGSGERTAEASESGAATAPLLHIAYRMAPASDSTSVRIANGTDDAEERLSDGDVLLDSTDLEFIDDAGYRGPQTVGLRFQNLNIPPNATILNAYLEFTTDEINNGPTSLTFYGQAADDPPAFSAGDHNISSRPTTTISVDWNNVPPWDRSGVVHQTPNLTPIVQEIVDRSGWASGNALVFIVTGSGERTAGAYEGAPTLAPRLYVEYLATHDLSISKISSAGGGPVDPGATITYTIVVSNTGTGTATGVTISDTLPAGTTYVPGSSQIVAPTTITETVRDEFNAVAYSGNDGTVNWAGNWLENDPYGGGGASGDYVRVVNGQLRFRWAYAYEENIRRVADLSGYTTATLSFDWETSRLDAGETIAVLVSDDGSTFTELDTFGGTQTGSATYDISSYISNLTTMRFENTSEDWESNEYAYFDNVQIKFSRRGIMTTTAGAPPDLVTFADGYDLQPGESMTVTFQVMVTNPPGVTQIVNTATVTSTETTTPTTATVTDTVATPDLSISKLSSAGGGPVDPGVTITYTLVVSNTGSGTATGMTISDALPAGTTYVPGSSQVIAPTTIIETVRDEFNAVAYSGNDGTVNWAGNWLENDPYGGGGASGDYVRVVNGRLRFRWAYAYEENIRRAADLSGYTTATLSFDWETSRLDAGETIAVLVSDDGSTFTELDTFGGTQTGSATYNISSYISNLTTVRFENTSVDWESNEYAHFDNVQIEFSKREITTTAAGAPPNLITAADGYDLQPGESMTVTFQVTVINPPGVPQIVNTAAVTCAEIIIPATATVTDTVATSNLSIVKSDNPDPVVAGTTLTYTLTYSNAGPLDAQAVSITDTLPLSVTYGGLVNQSPGWNGPAQTGQLLTWYTPTLAAGAVGTIIFTTTSDIHAVGALTNTAIITGNIQDAVPANNVAQEPTTIAPWINFDNPTYSVNESAGTATLTVTLNTVSPYPVTVMYATSDITAAAGSDYTASGGTLTFNPGVIRATFTVPILNDSLAEPSESLLLTLYNAHNAALRSPYTATLTIIDDDLPTVTFSAANYSVAESAGSASINVILDTASALVITVDYATSDGAAQAGSDYTAANGTLTFAPGVTLQSFMVPIIDDTDYEENETLFLTLSNPTGAVITGTNPAILTILNDDTPIPLAYYAMDEPSWHGTTGEVLDASDNHFHGTAITATTACTSSAIPGNPGACGYGIFNGQDAYISVPHHAALEPVEALTLMMWVRRDAQETADLLVKGKPSWRDGYMLGIDKWRGWFFTVQSTDTTTKTKRVRLGHVPDTGWRHIAGVFDGTSVTLYVDGAEVARQPFVSTQIYWHPSDRTDLQISSSAKPFSGAIDEVRIYDQSLAADDIVAIMNETHPCSYTRIYRIETHVGSVTIVAKVKIIAGKPVIISWEINP